MPGKRGCKPGEKRGGRKRGVGNIVKGESKRRLLAMLLPLEPKAVGVLKRHLTAGDGALRQRAAEFIIERLHGKAAQGIVIGEVTEEGEEMGNELVVRFVKSTQKD